MANNQAINNHKSSVTAKLTNELKFLVCCCKKNPSKEDVDFILFFIQNSNFLKLNSNTPVAKAQMGCNMENAFVLADIHGVLPQIYKTLKSLSKSHHSLEDLLTDLKTAYFQTARRNMFMSAELIRIMEVFKTSNIQALAFKGPTLSQMAYEDITFRQYSDLDILIKHKDRGKISEILKSQGYEQVLTLTSIQEKKWYKHAKDMSFFHPKKGIHIELHWLLLDNDYPIQIDLTSIWEHPQSIVILKEKVETFPTESLLVYLCIHGSKHLWERMVWIKDIDLLIRTQTIDWDLIVKKVSKSDFERMFLLGLYLSNSLFQTPLPTVLKKQMEHQNWLLKLSDFIISDQASHRNMFYNSLVMIHLFPGTRMKLRYLYKIILKPSQNEYRFIDLPEGYYWVYYFVRPYLLIKKYLMKM